MTAKLLDEGRSFILHLLNDSVDLWVHFNFAMAPAAQNYTEIIDPAISIKGSRFVVFAKKMPETWRN